MDPIQFTDHDVLSIEEGVVVEKGGESFVHSEVWDGDDAWILTEGALNKLRRGEKVQWSDNIVGVHEGHYEGDEDPIDDTTVSLNAEVDITGASDQQRRIYEQMADIFERRFELFVEKNLDYNSSFLTAGEVEQTLDSGDGPFDSEQEANLYKLFTRSQDKQQRFYQQAFCNGKDRVGEKISETSGDNMVYWAMITWLVENYKNSDINDE